VLDDLVRRLSLSAEFAPATDALAESIESSRKLLPDVWEKEPEEKLRRAA